MIFIEKGFEKRFNNGDIVYFVENKGREPSVEFGMVDEQFSDKVCIDYLVPKENRLVNGIKIDDFKNWEKPKKLPKGWTWILAYLKLHMKNILKNSKKARNDRVILKYATLVV